MTSPIAKVAALAALTGFCAGSALADGMIQQGSIKDAPVVVAAAPTWTGCYGGASLGMAFGRFRNETSTSDELNAGQFGTGNPVPAGSDPGYYFWAPGEAQVVSSAGQQTGHGNGVIGGGQLGCNRQSDRLVVGIEGDLSGMGMTGRTETVALYGDTQPGSTFKIRSSVSADTLFTLRGRVGVTERNWLFYATGGLALTTLNGTFNFSDTVTSAQESGDFRKVVAGYALGGGAEVMLGNGWSAKGEYLHLGFGRVSVKSNNFGGVNPGTGLFVSKPETFMTHSSKLDADILRLGLNHKF
jgi:outer membrane immunogenic protein